jgi:tetratricopeptide (TPR) repeat protein
MKLGLTCLLLLSVATGVPAQTNAGDELDQGVAAYKQAKFDEAVQHFKNVVALDPQKMVAHLYLATALAQQYIPGVGSPENEQLAKGAIAEYERVLSLDPRNVSSAKGIAYLYLQMKKFEEAKDYYHKAIALDSTDPETYYSIAVIDWTQAYQARMEVRAKLGLNPDSSLITVGDCWTVRAVNQDRVRDGIEMLTQALTLGPDYDDAMAYMNLLYRERADIQCSDGAALSSDLREADKWVDLTIATKKRKAEKTQKSDPVNNLAPKN